MDRDDDGAISSQEFQGFMELFQGTSKKRPTEEPYKKYLPPKVQQEPSPIRNRKIVPNVISLIANKTASKNQDFDKRKKSEPEVRPSFYQGKSRNYEVKNQADQKEASTVPAHPLRTPYVKRGEESYQNSLERRSNFSQGEPQTTVAKQQPNSYTKISEKPSNGYSKSQAVTPQHEKTKTEKENQAGNTT